MHNQILGEKPGYEVDHIFGDGLDNRRKHLRHVTHRQNTQNLHRVTSSKYPGVSWDKRARKWKAHIRIKDHVKTLGHYHNELDAFRAYQRAIETLEGEPSQCILMTSWSASANMM